MRYLILFSLALLAACTNVQESIPPVKARQRVSEQAIMERQDPVTIYNNIYNTVGEAGSALPIPMDQIITPLGMQYDGDETMEGGPRRRRSRRRSRRRIRRRWRRRRVRRRSRRRRGINPYFRRRNDPCEGDHVSGFDLACQLTDCTIFDCADKDCSFTSVFQICVRCPFHGACTQTAWQGVWAAKIWPEIVGDFNFFKGGDCCDTYYTSGIPQALKVGATYSAGKPPFYDNSAQWRRRARRRAFGVVSNMDDLKTSSADKLNRHETEVAGEEVGDAKHEDGSAGDGAPTPAPTPAPTIGWCSSGVRNGQHCCGANCGTCGGSNCDKRPGGGMQCCMGNLKNVCTTATQTACLVPAATPAPTPSPTNPTATSTGDGTGRRRRSRRREFRNVGEDYYYVANGEAIKTTHLLCPWLNYKKRVTTTQSHVLRTFAGLTMICNDGTACDTGGFRTWACCNDKKGRKICPSSQPHMCDSTACAEHSDWCCGQDCSPDPGSATNAENGKTGLGIRPCYNKADDQPRSAAETSSSVTFCPLNPANPTNVEYPMLPCQTALLKEQDCDADGTPDYVCYNYARAADGTWTKMYMSSRHCCKVFDYVHTNSNPTCTNALLNALTHVDNKAAGRVAAYARRRSDCYNPGTRTYKSTPAPTPAPTQALSYSCEAYPGELYRCKCSATWEVYNTVHITHNAFKQKDGMHGRVWGIKHGQSWETACDHCGKYLQQKKWLATGWKCKKDKAGWMATGIWLLGRKTDTSWGVAR